MNTVQALNPKRSRFVDEFLIDLNATQAATRAGYSPRTANEQGSRLLADASVAAAIAEGQRTRSERTEITQDWVLTNLRDVAERCMAEGEFDSAGACRALELLGRHMGLFVDRHRIEAAMNVIAAEPMSEEEWVANHGARQ